MTLNISLQAAGLRNESPKGSSMTNIIRKRGTISCLMHSENTMNPSQWTPALVLWHRAPNIRLKACRSSLTLMWCDHVYLYVISLWSDYRTASLHDEYKHTDKQPRVSTCGKWERWERSWQRGRRGPDRQTPSLVVAGTVRGGRQTEERKHLLMQHNYKQNHSAHVAYCVLSSEQ